MIDMLSLFLSHGLLLLAAWRLMGRGDLDDDKAPADTRVTRGKWDGRNA